MSKKARSGWHSVAVEMCFHPDWLPKPIEWSSDVEIRIDNGEIVDWLVPEFDGNNAAFHLACLTNPEDTEGKAVAKLHTYTRDILTEAARRDGLI